MTKKYSVLLKVITVLLGVVLVIINLYPLVKGVELFAGASIINDILFIGIFTLIGIERVKAKGKYGNLYLVVPVVMAIILLLKYITRII